MVNLKYIFLGSQADYQSMKISIFCYGRNDQNNVNKST